jgi:hypothetical protein
MPTRVTRRIAADPTSTALLLAGPTAVDLWPGARRVGDETGGVRVEAHLGDGAAVADVVTVKALPPRRTPTSYVTRFSWTASAAPGGAGRLTLAYAPTATGTPLTHAVLELELDDDRLDARAVSGLAEGFLANLGRAAEARSRAA